MKKTAKKIISGSMAVIMTAFALLCDMPAYEAKAAARPWKWDALEYLEFRNGEGAGVHSLKDITEHGDNYTIDGEPLYQDASHYFDDIQMSINSRVTYGKKVRVNNGQRINIIAAKQDSAGAGGETINAGLKFYWSIVEYDINGNAIFDGAWKGCDQTWTIGQSHNGTDYGTDGHAYGVSQKDREEIVSYIMPIFRWNNGDSSVGGGQDLFILTQALADSYPNFYLVTDPFTYTFNCNGGTAEGADEYTRQRLGMESLPDDTIIEPTRAGYTFSGWKITGGSGKQEGLVYSTKQLTAMLQDGKYWSSLFENATFEAQWSINSYPLDVNCYYYDEKTGSWVHEEDDFSYVEVSGVSNNIDSNVWQNDLWLYPVWNTQYKIYAKPASGWEVSGWSDVAAGEDELEGFYPSSSDFHTGVMDAEAENGEAAKVVNVFVRHKEHNLKLNIAHQNADGSWSSTQEWINEPVRGSASYHYDRYGTDSTGADNAEYEQVCVKGTMPDKDYEETVRVYRQKRGLNVSVYYRANEEKDFEKQDNSSGHFLKFNIKQNGGAQDASFTAEWNQKLRVGATVSFKPFASQGYRIDHIDVMDGDKVIATYNDEFTHTLPVTYNGYEIRVYLKPTDYSINFNYAHDATNPFGNLSYDTEAENAAKLTKNGTDTIPVKYENKVGTLPLPTLTGAEFIKWVDENGTTYTADTIYMVQGNTTLYAVWEELTGEFTYNSNNVAYNNNGVGILNKTFEAGSKNVMSDNVTLENNMFGKMLEKDDIFYTEEEGRWDKELRNYIFMKGGTSYAYTVNNGKSTYYSFQGWSTDPEASVVTDKDAGLIHSPGYTDRYFNFVYERQAFLKTSLTSDYSKINASIDKRISSANAIRAKADDLYNEKNLSKDETDVTMYAIWDEYPEINAPSSIFIPLGYLDEFLTLTPEPAFNEGAREKLENALSERISVTDREDEDLKIEFEGLDSIMEQIIVVKKSFICPGREMSTRVSVTDSAGNTTYSYVTVYIPRERSLQSKPEIIDPNSDIPPIGIPTHKARVITRKYYDYGNKDSENYKSDYSLATFRDYGGLLPNSVWYTKPHYKAVIEKTFDNLENNTPEQVWYFTHEQVLEVQRYIDKNGLGNSRRKDALQEFYDTFEPKCRIK